MNPFRHWGNGLLGGSIFWDPLGGLGTRGPKFWEVKGVV